MIFGVFTLIGHADVSFHVALHSATLTSTDIKIKGIRKREERHFPENVSLPFLIRNQFLSMLGPKKK